MIRAVLDRLKFEIFKVYRVEVDLQLGHSKTYFCLTLHLDRYTKFKKIRNNNYLKGRKVMCQ